MKQIQEQANLRSKKQRPKRPKGSIIKEVDFNTILIFLMSIMIPLTFVIILKVIL